MITMAMDAMKEPTYWGIVFALLGAALATALAGIGSIKGADKILVLDEGRAVGFGTHETLLTDCPPYAELNALQSGGEPCARP